MNVKRGADRHRPEKREICNNSTTVMMVVTAAWQTAYFNALEALL